MTSRRILSSHSPLPNTQQKCAISPAIAGKYCKFCWVWGSADGRSQICPNDHPVCAYRAAALLLKEWKNRFEVKDQILSTGSLMGYDGDFPGSFGFA
jgi:hypothetical protein